MDGCFVLMESVVDDWIRCRAMGFDCLSQCRKNGEIGIATTSLDGIGCIKKRFHAGKKLIVEFDNFIDNLNCTQRERETDNTIIVRGKVK